MIFEYIIEAASPKAAPKTADDWVKLGLEYQSRKKTISAKMFAAEKGIVYGTFTKAMSRYASRIMTAMELEGIKGKRNLTKSEQQLKLINDFRSTLRDKAKNVGAAANNKSLKWFAEVQKTIKGHVVTKPTPGRLYTFAYDAKYKDTLPYWDKYPLIVFLHTGRAANGGPLFYGLNLHYIPPKARQSFLEELLKNYSSTKSITNKTRLKINWSNVKGMKGTDEMIKSYLPGHFKGAMVEIKPQDWSNVIFMPTQSFMSGKKRYSARKVWK